MRFLLTQSPLHFFMAVREERAPLCAVSGRVFTVGTVETKTILIIVLKKLFGKPHNSVCY